VWPEGKASEEGLEMPYKRKGRVVYVKKAGRWKILKRHPSVKKAEAHRKALEANVRHR
jgi:hypothetical protein